MTIWTALPLGQSACVKHLNHPSAVLMVADGVLSPWNAHLMGRGPRSSVMPSSNP